MLDWASRMVPPPMVPTSMLGMETEIWRLPFVLAGGTGGISKVYGR